MIRIARPITIALAFALALPGTGLAQWPDKPIRLYVPFPAGGAVDIVARLLADKLTADLGKPVVIENKAGAGGILATDATAKAAPDGTTLLLTTPNHGRRCASPQCRLVESEDHLQGGRRRIQMDLS